MNETTKNWLARAAALTVFGLTLAMPCQAQVAQLTSNLDWIKTTLNGIALVTVVIAVMFVGYKFLFGERTQIRDVMHVIIGAVIIGGAAAIGAQLLGSGAA